MKKLYSLIDFIIFYSFDLVSSALKIAFDIVTVEKNTTPGIMKAPLSTDRDIEIAIIANLVTFSPGTMVVGISEDKKYLLIHTMFKDHEEENLIFFKEKIEKRVMELLR